mmetsp:Transcript_87864/g.128497  ORF Transcript_87864/g.128497 Transcript_87864/m.128497 type:complete len:236 (-) Transcript_87864:319-1026(-)
MVDFCTPQRLARLTRACKFRMNGLRLVLDGLADPGNRAAVIRSSEALGLLHVHVVPCAGPTPHVQFRKRMSRSITTGSEKWMKVHYHQDVDECISMLRNEGFNQILTAKPENPDNDVCHNPIPLQKIDFAKRTALVFGNEKNGISPHMSQICDGDFHVPMLGLTESFNVSVAAAICIHWGRNAREKSLGGASDLTESEQEELLLQYLSINTANKEHRHLLKEVQAQMSSKTGKAG